MTKKLIISFLIIPIIIVEIILFDLLITSSASGTELSSIAISYDKELYEKEIIPLPVKRNFIRWEINENIDNLSWPSLVEFYTQYTKNVAVTESIMNAALKHDVPINLSFALAWKESRYNPNAYNHNFGSSYDRGLYQLNSTYRKDWPEEQFFNIAVNSLEGNEYLSYCLNLADRDIEKALYGYNAGPDAILEGNVPRRSIQYAIEIIEYEDFLTVEFNKRFGYEE